MKIHKNDLIKIVSYDAQWPEKANIEIKKIYNVFSENFSTKFILNIQHVGSTAVPGMPAKPVIDIQIAVNSLKDIKSKSAAIDILKNNGYLYWQENPDKERLFFIKFAKGMPPLGQQRTHHVHMVDYHSRHWQDKILFRDYLIAHSETAQAYKILKIKLARQYAGCREKYTDSKTEFIHEILTKAYNLYKLRRTI